MTVVLVLIGGAVGAPLRYVTDLYVQARHDSVFPWGTLIVNVTGSFVLGLVAQRADQAAAPEWLLPLVGTGLCGALTTFSTFSFETVRLVEEGSWWEASANVVASLVAGAGACSLGWLAGAAM